ncbi:lysophospholipid acyltransferase family protein [Nevskia ramosa]|uniref:lysophospholipid acyltransferase family protein n=1 Tax=Nevskia ramosa TaxID=64002 RepID=UPI0003B6A282|nr:lysophospholipid acyltransferase family protein [Nevskia ramosa]
MTYLRVGTKGLRVISHLLVGLLLPILVIINGRGRWSRENLATWWHRVLLRILDVKLIVRGTPLAGTKVMVCNHISWLDIPVVAACEATRFVSKAEVGEWPVIGWLADACGTFYLRRGSGGTKQLIEAIDQHLGRDSIVFFPEGTTTDGSIVLKFQPRLFATAIETKRPVQPIALRFSRAADGTATAPYIGDDVLLDNIIRLLKHGAITAEIIYCAAIDPEGHDRASLAHAAHTAICSAIAPDSIRTLIAREARDSIAA